MFQRLVRVSSGSAATTIRYRLLQKHALQQFPLMRDSATRSLSPWHSFSTTASPPTTSSADHEDGSGMSTQNGNNSSLGGTTTQPPLKRIPTLPVFGSMISFYSGVPPFDMNNFVHYMRKIMKEHGPFFTIGFPGFGAGSHGTVYVVRDPMEMLKVLKQQGSYPSGLVEKEWPLLYWMEKKIRIERHNG